MSRWAPDAAERLHAAAMQLFLEQGFAETTVPQITQRAGLTTRSFFRYYADKREALFAGEEGLPDVVERVFTEADPQLTPLEVIRFGMVAVIAPHLAPFRGTLLARARIVETDPGLQERHLRKMGVLHEAASRAFRDRGLPPLEADLAGRLAATVFDTVLTRWLSEDGARFEAVTTEVLDSLVRLTGNPGDRVRSG